MTHDAQATIDSLDALLERERQFLLDGEIEQIEDVLAEKELLVQKLSDLDRQELQNLESLQAKFSRNQTLLDGALHGIRRTAARLATLRQVRRTLETYDESGHKKIIEGHVTHKLEKRA